MDWNEVGTEKASKLQRRACHRWGIPSRLVAEMNALEAHDMLSVLARIGERANKEKVAVRDVARKSVRKGKKVATFNLTAVAGNMQVGDIEFTLYMTK
jgi:hypothetical protein